MSNEEEYVEGLLGEMFWQLVRDLEKKARKLANEGDSKTADVLTLLAQDAEKKALELGGAKKQSKPEKVAHGEREKLQRQIGALALVISEKGGRYKRGDKPNAKNIAQDALLDASSINRADIRGLSDTEMRASIAAGLRLLTAD